MDVQRLHWLPVNQRIKFKLTTLTHNTLNSSQPAYLHSLLSYHIPAHSLRSSNTNLLSVLRVHTTFASRDFSVSAPQYGTHSHLAFALVRPKSVHSGNGQPLLALHHLVSLPVSTPLRIVNRCWSGVPCKWWYINVKTFNLLTFFNLADTAHY